MLTEHRQGPEVNSAPIDCHVISVAHQRKILLSTEMLNFGGAIDDAIVDVKVLIMFRCRVSGMG